MAEENNLDLVRSIRKLRQSKRLSQQQLADHLNIERSTYACYESGRIRISVDTMVALAHFYRVSYAEIIGVPENIYPGDERNRKGLI